MYKISENIKMMQNNILQANKLITLKNFYLPIYVLYNYQVIIKFEDHMENNSKKNDKEQIIKYSEFIEMTDLTSQNQIIQNVQNQKDIKPTSSKNIQNPQTKSNQIPSSNNQNLKNNNPNPIKPPQKKIRLPNMEVVCKWCTLKQSINGNSEILICSACNNMTACLPKYNLFVCYNCKVQVCYELYISQFIKCTRCNTVNKVPKKIKQINQILPYRIQENKILIKQEPLIYEQKQYNKKKEVDLLEYENSININSKNIANKK